MTPGAKNKSIGYWMSDKKIQKSNVHVLKDLCKRKGYSLVKLDLNKSLEEQGPFSVILHKCTDIIVKANAGDFKCQEMLRRIEEYLIKHPEVPIVDPLEKIRRVLNRYKSYLAIRDNPRLTSFDVFLPTIVELTSDDASVNLATLKAAGVVFPFICKPLVSHGCEAHKMAVIFNEKGVADCETPAVAQTFINHNAVLYKIYCVGDQYVTVERPSLKNFNSIESLETIHFFTTDVSKANSTSNLTMLDANDPMRKADVATLDSKRLKRIIHAIQEDVGIALVGIDIVIDNESGRYAVIDINVFPGYDGFPNVWEAVLTHLERAMREHVTRVPGTPVTTLTPDGVSPTADHDDSGFDTSDSSDEKNRLVVSPLR